jgi:1,4-dihydroxy-2-naphthoate octaprenyltransferase
VKQIPNPKSSSHPFDAWLLAARPKTLVASIMPVALGAAYAYATRGSMAWNLLFYVFASALCIQIGTNFANDYSDFKKGADAGKRLGPTRVTQAGLLSPEQVLRGTWTMFVLAVMFAMPLMMKGGWPIVIIGALSILFGWMYTGGPYPLGYHGLGEVFVFLFFGLAAVMGTSYLLVGWWTWQSAVLAVCPGLFATAILTINNVRDIESDRKAGKHTLPAIFDRSFGRAEYICCIIGAMLIPVVLFMLNGKPYVLFPLLMIPVSFKPIKLMLTKTDGPSLNKALAETAKLQLIFGAFFIVGLLI